MIDSLKEGQTDNFMIGEIMMALDHVNSAQILNARKIQNDNPDKRLGECMVELGYTSKETVLECLKVQDILNGTD